MEKQPTPLENSALQNHQNSQDSGLDLISDDQESTSPRMKKDSVETIARPNIEDSKEAQRSPQDENKVTDNIQSPKRKRQSGEKKPQNETKTESDPQKPKKYRPKKQFAHETKKHESPKNQRQPNPQTKETTKIPQGTKLASTQDKNQKPKEQEPAYDMQWTGKNVDSDTQKNKQGEEQQQQQEPVPSQTTAILQDQEIQILISRPQQNQLNVGMIQKQVTLKYEHWVENKHLLVLYLLFRQELYDLFPKKVNKTIDLHPSNRNKIRIYGSTQEELKEITGKISELIQKIAIVKLNIRNEQAAKLKSSKLLNERLLKDKIVIFRYGNSGQKSYYLGGKGTQPQLSAVFRDIRNLKFRYFRMFDYKNTRSYNIMLGHFIRQKQLLKEFFKWGIKNLQIVPYIPNFNHHGKKDREKSLCFLMTTSSNTENFSPKDIELSIMPFVKDNFYSIALIFKKGEKYLPKLSLDGVFFKFVFEKKFSWAYVYIMCLKQDFYAKRDQIILEIKKLAEKNRIFGVRYFDHISPSRANYIKPEIYKEVSYPENNPYSSSIIAKRIGWDEVENNKYINDKKEEKKEQGEMKENQERGWHTFDWKEHLLSIKDEVNPFKELKK